MRLKKSLYKFNYHYLKQYGVTNNFSIIIKIFIFKFIRINQMPKKTKAIKMNNSCALVIVLKPCGFVSCHTLQLMEALKNLYIFFTLMYKVRKKITFFILCIIIV